MHFWKVNDSYRGSLIAGPVHNFLGLRLGEDRNLRVIRVRDEPFDAGFEEAMTEAVVDEVQRASRAIGCEYPVAEIEYVPSDSRSIDNYRRLAQAIIKYIHSQERPT